MLELKNKGVKGKPMEYQVGRNKKVRYTPL